MKLTYYAPPLRGKWRCPLYAVLMILVLLFGLAFASPLPQQVQEQLGGLSSSVSHLGVDTADQETKSFSSQFHTAPFIHFDENEKVPDAVEINASSGGLEEDLQQVSITSPTMFQQQGDSSKSSVKDSVEPSEPVILAEDSSFDDKTSDRNVHVTSEVRTVSFQINKKIPKARTGNLSPPLVFAQQPPDINLEPTEVEAPGTTPTTIAMVTGSIPVIVNNSPITSIDRSFATEANKDIVVSQNDKSVVEDDIGIPSKHAYQGDDPRTLAIKSYPSLGNVTRTVVKSRKVKSSSVQTREAFSPPTAFSHVQRFSAYSQRAQSSEVPENNNSTSSPISISGEFTSSTTSEDTISNPTPELVKHVSINDDLIIPILLENEQAPKEKNILSKNDSFVKQHQSSDPLALESTNSNLNNKTLFSSSSKNVNLHNKMPVITDLIPSKDLPINNKKLSETLINSDRSQTKETNLSPVVLETREASEDSFFHTLDSSHPTEKRKSRIYIKNDSEDAKEKQDQYVLESSADSKKGLVYSASSEIDYRNFNPAISSNHTSVNHSKASIDPENTSTSSSFNPITIIDWRRAILEGDPNAPVEEPHISSVKITYNNVAPISRDPTHSSQNFSSNISSPSSSLRRETSVPAPSHLPKVRSSDSRDPIPLGVYPKQERVTITISEHIERPLSAGYIVAIVIGVLLSLIVAAGGIGYYWFTRHTGIRSKVLFSDRSCANSDSGGYLDDQCRVAYVNSQVDLSKSSPEDLVSLDNDSFLNSLESMTIQNLWTDSIRHTKL